MYAIYLLFVSILGVYSYALVDPNFTLFNHPFWEWFRNSAVSLGYYNRGMSWYIYLVIIVVLFGFQYFFVRNFKKYNPVRLSVFIGILLLFSYPFLSHDFFNYLFDAKIVTVYHQNPYVLRALDFPKDPWVRFMHWTHRTYPYGPSFLLISLIPSFLGFGKLLLHYFFFKLLFTSSYIGSVFLLSKIDKRYGLFFATSPIVIIEGLVNAHNDMIGIFLAFLGISLLFQNKKYVSRLVLSLSVLIKYLSLPLLVVSRKRSALTLMAFVFIHGLIAYLSISQEIQGWYFLNIFIFIPWYFDYIQQLSPLYMGILLSYYPYIRLDGWNGEGVPIKHIIILFSLGVTVPYVIYANRIYLKTLFLNR